MATINLTKENLEETINNNKMVIIDFWAEWCGPCKSFGPTFEKVSEEYPDIVFAKVDTEAQQELGSMFQIRSIPTVMMFKEQIIIFKEAGALPESSLKEVLERVTTLDMETVRADIKAQEAEAKS
jgi:thioredoxin 1